MVRSSKEKKSDISSLFSIEVGSTQITDGFKQLRDYYLRLLDDDTGLRKEIENNFFCDENGGVRNSFYKISKKLNIGLLFYLLICYNSIKEVISKWLKSQN